MPAFTPVDNFSQMYLTIYANIFVMVAVRNMLVKDPSDLLTCCETGITWYTVDRCQCAQPSRLPSAADRLPQGKILSKHLSFMSQYIFDEE